MPSDASVQVVCRTSYFKTEQSTPHRSAVLGSSLMLNSVLGWSWFARTTLPLELLPPTELS